MDFMHLVFTGMLRVSYRKVFVVFLCDAFRALINPLVLILHELCGPRSVSDHGTASRARSSWKLQHPNVNAANLALHV